MGNHTQSTLHLLSKRSSERMLDKYHRDELVTCHQYWSTIKNELKECQQQSWESSKDLYKVPYLIFACNRLPTPFLSFQKHLGQGPKAPRLTKGIFNKASTSGPTLHETWQVGKIMVILNKYPCKYMCISKEVDIHSYIHTFIPSSIHPFMPSCLHAFVLSYLHTMNEKQIDRIGLIG